jgi:phosphate transport system permease protein
VVRRSTRENLATGEVSESFERFAAEAPRPPTVLVLDDDQESLFGGTAGGELLWWDLSGGQPGPPQVVGGGGSAITALSLLIGHRSLAVGQADGSLSVWFPVRRPDDSFLLTRIRDFPPLPGAVERIAPSMRNKGFIAAGGGILGLYHSTSHRTLATLPTSVARPAAITYAPRTDGAFLAEAGRIAAVAIDNPHPEVNLKSLFGKVWYEGYEEPRFVWQSTGGTDDFEPKLSLTPLLVGTLKGTFYSLLLAIPLGVLGAMYTSQFMHPTYQRFVKPTVEIMAALPTVVLGFLAGLWLAPRLQQVFPGLLLMLLVLPALVLAAGTLWQRLPRVFRNRFPTGIEALLFVAVLALGMWLCVELSVPLEALAFDGSFPAWVLATTGLTYDQRNAVVVGLAMGFAVIPIIFAISEDAFSNVPANLVSGSLALGANRWQTVTRVVLPTASPGIFSAVMVGFGRAVGETMIVLMATGNTPIMDWSPFNGFRTLSANIAVEIPEAPVSGTLYRALFLAGLLLFALTFAVNTVAEVVRQRLRRRYSQL